MPARLDFTEVHLPMGAVGEELRKVGGVSVTYNTLSRGTAATVLHVIDVRLGRGHYLVIRALQLELGRFGIRAHYYRGHNKSDILHTWDITSADHYNVELGETYNCIRCAQDCSAGTCPATAPHAAMELSRIEVELTSWCQQTLAELQAAAA